ncbi:hypothetical protein F5876DRAFT_83039 [Lentinula aff. lateritia]|uniref:Uncharacterized protein n=1 Tax=Lentinula aff. lateritia TaxID=2804960 RepID=A0ACC1TIM0_9AGAR|nr:hypothetical protein F5876DRAFT_83039 [Lentinula aff. lateritia]
MYAGKPCQGPLGIKGWRVEWDSSEVINNTAIMPLVPRELPTSCLVATVARRAAEKKRQRQETAAQATSARKREEEAADRRRKIAAVAANQSRQGPLPSEVSTSFQRVEVEVSWAINGNPNGGNNKDDNKDEKAPLANKQEGGPNPTGEWIAILESQMAQLLADNWQLRDGQIRTNIYQRHLLKKIDWLNMDAARGRKLPPVVLVTGPSELPKKRRRVADSDEEEFEGEGNKIKGKKKKRKEKLKMSKNRR